MIVFTQLKNNRPLFCFGQEKMFLLSHSVNFCLYGHFLQNWSLSAMNIIF